MFGDYSNFKEKLFYENNMDKFKELLTSNEGKEYLTPIMNYENNKGIWESIVEKKKIIAIDLMVCNNLINNNIENANMSQVKKINEKIEQLSEMIRYAVNKMENINEIKEILKVRDKFQEESNECASQIYWKKSRD